MHEEISTCTVKYDHKKPTQAIFVRVGESSFVVVMTAALCNVKLIVFNSIDKTIFFIDPSTEEALQVPLQCFRFTNAFQGAVSINILY